MSPVREACSEKPIYCPAQEQEAFLSGPVPGHLYPRFPSLDCRVKAWLCHVFLNPPCITVFRIHDGSAHFLSSSPSYFVSGYSSAIADADVYAVLTVTLRSGANV